MNEWISVKERLPLDNREVWFVRRQAHGQPIVVGGFGSFCGWGKWQDTTNNVEIEPDDVLFWQYIVVPKPPKPEGPFKAISCEGGYAVGHYITGDDYFRFLPSEVLPEEQARKLAEWLNEMWSYRD